MNFLNNLSKTLFSSCSQNPPEEEIETLSTSDLKSRKKGKMVENEATEDLQAELLTEDDSFDFSLTKKDADKTAVNSKIMKEVLKSVKPEIKEIYKKYGQWKYSLYDWYSLGIDKNDLTFSQEIQGYWGHLRTGSKTKEGKGVYVTENGDLYEGFFKHGRQYGKGRMIFSNKTIYQGDFKNGVPHGFGIFIDCETGGMRKSEFKNGKNHGDGIEQWPDGSTFKGIYNKGRKQGFGIFNWADGSSYEGNLHQDQLDGLGTLTMKDERKYEGYFKDNQMHGEGTFYWPDGKKYVGAYENGEKHGKGKMTLADGNEYYGEWIEGEVHGEAIFTDKKGKKTKKIIEKGELKKQLTNLF